MKTKKKMPACLMFLGLALTAGCRTTSGLDPVSGFELERYLGTWYEAARFPHRFEKGLTSVSAQYSLNTNGTVKVVNRGYDPEKEKWKEAVGVAKFKDDPNQGWLKVSFFGPFFATYKIIHLDEDYREAIVTGPNFNYFWILVRDPATPASEIDRLVRMADEFGFDTNRIERIEHGQQP